MMLFQKFEENCCNERKYSSVQHFINSRSEELIHDLLLPRAGERLLDVGCGTGDRLIYFRNQGCTVSGIDSSIERVEIAKKRLIHKADITSGSAEDLPFSDNEFDIVTLINTFGFGGDPQKAISEAVRVSRDRVLVVTWNKYALLNSYDRVKYILWNKSNTLQDCLDIWNLFV
jgi:ubiquinone/menaquinone biosynthesis C-methylase UbiE